MAHYIIVWQLVQVAFVFPRILPASYMIRLYRIYRFIVCIAKYSLSTHIFMYYMHTYICVCVSVCNFIWEKKFLSLLQNRLTFSNNLVKYLHNTTINYNFYNLITIQ